MPYKETFVSVTKLIREKYPHLSPVELMDGDDYPPAITEPILAFLKAEYEDMFFQVIEVANRYYARNLTLV
jgi:bisphosphoglycerate-independent phosphoglycerate mutase (AlkP superfamily)